MNQLERAKTRLAGDFKAMIADSEDLLEATASVTGEGLSSARAQFEAKVERARKALAKASEPMIGQVRDTAAATDDYVRSNAWGAVGVAIVAGVLVGFLAARR